MADWVAGWVTNTSIVSSKVLRKLPSAEMPALVVSNPSCARISKLARSNTLTCSPA